MIPNQRNFQKVRFRHTSKKSWVIESLEWLKKTMQRKSITIFEVLAFRHISCILKMEKSNFLQLKQSSKAFKASFDRENHMRWIKIGFFSQRVRKKGKRNSIATCKKIRTFELLCIWIETSLSSCKESLLMRAKESLYAHSATLFRYSNPRVW